jgi:hypothetical protein
MHCAIAVRRPEIRKEIRQIHTHGGRLDGLVLWARRLRRRGAPRTAEWLTRPSR